MKHGVPSASAMAIMPGRMTRKGKSIFGIAIICALVVATARRPRALGNQATGLSRHPSRMSTTSGT